MVKDFSYGGPTILQSPFVVEVVLPFLLVFTVVFAILQKSKVLGDGKKQMDALVALVVGLIFVSFANAVGIVVWLMPFLAVSLVVIIVFLILWGSVWGETVPNAVKYTIGVLVSIAVVSAVVYITGTFDYLYNLVGSENGSGIFFNVVIILAVIAAIIVAYNPFGGGKKDK